MTGNDRLDAEFEKHRSHLNAVAYRMLGSVDDANDALQEAWLRIHGRGPMESIDDTRAWLTTVVGRVCLNMLRTHRTRREVFADPRVPDPIVTLADRADTEHDVLLAESIGPALLMALEALTPAERFCFVLHDVFGVRFAELAAALDRSEAAVQQLASRGRRRLRNVPPPEADLARQRVVVDAFFAASREGNFDALLEVLHPEVHLRIDGGVLRADETLRLRGAEAVVGHTVRYAALSPFVRPALVNGTAGAVVVTGRGLFSVMAFAIADGRITAIDALVDPARLALLGLDLGPPALRAAVGRALGYDLS